MHSAKCRERVLVNVELIWLQLPDFTSKTWVWETSVLCRVSNLFHFSKAGQKSNAEGRASCFQISQNVFHMLSGKECYAESDNPQTLTTLYYLRTRQLQWGPEEPEVDSSWIWDSTRISSPGWDPRAAASSSSLIPSTGPKLTMLQPALLPFNSSLTQQCSPVGPQPAPPASPRVCKQCRRRAWGRGSGSTGTAPGGGSGIRSGCRTSALSLQGRCSRSIHFPKIPSCKFSHDCFILIL